MIVCGCGHSNCAAVWKSAGRNEKAEALDAHAPSCGCQAQSLRDPPGTPVHDDELIVRVLTSPDGYETSTEEILSRRFTALFSSGVSVIRQGASDDEIRLTVGELTMGPEPRSLVGCVLVKAAAVRSLEFPGQVFCIYDTEDGQKLSHADILCAMPVESSNSQNKRKNDARRRALCVLFQQHVRLVNDVDQLIGIVREEEKRA